MTSPSEIPGTSAERYDSPGSSPSAGRRLQHANVSGTNQFLRFFFRTRDDSRNIQNFISSEGSITQTAWNGISKNSTLKVRLKTVETLQELVTKRRLQVSTLEGIWNETRDMLDIEALRAPFLSLMIAITNGQIEEIGLALRKSFFETISEIGLEEASLRWLRFLTVEGRSIEPFEFAVGELLARWLEQVIDDDESPLAEQVVRLCDGLICGNSAYVDDTCLVTIIRACCRRLCHKADHLSGSILSCLEAVLKYNKLPKTELPTVIMTLCPLSAQEEYSAYAWKLMRLILSSVNAYSALRLLQEVLSDLPANASERIPHQKLVVILRGAVFTVSMALWGAQASDNFA